MAEQYSVSGSPNHLGMQLEGSGTLNFFLESNYMNNLHFSAPTTGIQSGSQSMPTNELEHEHAPGVLQPEDPVHRCSNLLERFVEPNQVAVDNTGQNNFTREDQMLYQNVTMQPQRQREKILIQKVSAQVKKKVKKEMATLKAENDDLKAKNADLETKNADLKAENDDLKAKHAELFKRYNRVISASSTMISEMEYFMNDKINGS